MNEQCQQNYKSWKVNRCIIIDLIEHKMINFNCLLRQEAIGHKEICYRSLKASGFGGNSISEGRNYGCREVEKSKVHYTRKYIIKCSKQYSFSMTSNSYHSSDKVGKNLLFC